LERLTKQTDAIHLGSVFLFDNLPLRATIVTPEIVMTTNRREAQLQRTAPNLKNESLLAYLQETRWNRGLKSSERIYEFSCSRLGVFIY